jgi:hypothetical protein
MSLKQRLNQDLHEALKSGDAARRNVVRLLLAAVKQAELDKRAALAKQMGKGGELSAGQLAELGQVALSDDELLGVIQKEARVRRESLAEAQSARRADLVAANEAELRLIESYLPQPLTQAELVALAQAAIAEVGATELKHLGLVMKVLAPRTKGRADGKRVSEVVRELLAG